MKSRENFEYRLAKKKIMVQDYLKAIEYELSLVNSNNLFNKL